MRTPLLSDTFCIACSPRAGGNSDRAAALFADAYAAAGGMAPLPLFLRDQPVLPCVACDACKSAPQASGAFSVGAGTSAPPGLHALYGEPENALLTFGCPQARRDGSASLLNRLAFARSMCLVSPIYFYHLPAQLKALLDRTQPFWHLHNMGFEGFRARERRCHVILLGAREKGERLFEGSLLSIKYALAGAGIRLADPLLLYGLDAASDLASDDGIQERIRKYAENAALADISNLPGGSAPAVP